MLEKSTKKRNILLYGVECLICDILSSISFMCLQKLPRQIEGQMSNVSEVWVSVTELSQGPQERSSDFTREGIRLDERHWRGFPLVLEHTCIVYISLVCFS